MRVGAIIIEDLQFQFTIRYLLSHLFLSQLQGHEAQRADNRLLLYRVRSSLRQLVIGLVARTLAMYFVLSRVAI